MNERGLRDLYGERTARSASDRARCLSAHDLMSVARPEGDGAASERLLDHVAGCSSCAGEIKMLRSLAIWSERLAQDLQAEEGDDELAERRGRKRSRGPWSVPAAAVFALAALGLGLWGAAQSREAERLRAALGEGGDAGPRVGETRAELERAREAAAAAEASRDDLEERLAVLSRPQGNVTLFDLDPDTAVARGDGSGATALVVSRDAPFFTLILQAASDSVGEALGFAVLRGDGRTVFAGDGLEVTAYGAVTLALSPDALEEGEYRLRLFRGDDPTEPLESYSFRVSYR